MRRYLPHYATALTIAGASMLGVSPSAAGGGYYASDYYDGGYASAYYEPRARYVASAPYYRDGYAPTAYYGYAPYGYYRSYPSYAGYPGWGRGYYGYRGYGHQRPYSYRW